ncbi:MAG: hypothetical protein JWN50_619, partial [Parcubacteria group bacterium]|nr:hypothetical protein [Parcubacteria group bacterium]
MQLISTDFNDGTCIPEKFSGDGENISPELRISGVPEGTTCLALIMDDPDAPQGTFVHWVLWDIPFSTSVFSSKNLPEGTKIGKNGG